MPCFYSSPPSSHYIPNPTAGSTFPALQIDAPTSKRRRTRASSAPSPTNVLMPAPPAMKPTYLVAASYVSKVAHVLAFTSFVLVLVWVLHFRGGAARLNSDDPNLIFNVHPLTMCLGFILIIGEGIMAYKTVALEKELQKSVHMMLHLVALGLGILGVYAAFKYHTASAIPDMISLHSWLGICTICLFGLQWLFGFYTFWFPRASHPARMMLLPLHVYAGLTIFLMTVCTAETGFVQMEAAPGVEARLVNFTGLFILLFALAVSISVALPRVVSL